MSGKRQKTQCSLALEPEGRGEASAIGCPRAEPPVATPEPGSPAATEQLMKEVCDGENLQSAWKRVRRNQGSPGVDGMTIEDAKACLREHWAKHTVSIARRNPPAAAGQAGRNAQAGRRGQKSSACLASSTD